MCQSYPSLSWDAVRQYAGQMGTNRFAKMKESDYSVRDYFAPIDYEMVIEWWEAHGHPVVPAHLLAPVGFIAGQDGADMAAVWVYFDNCTPVCFAERAVTAPGLSVADASGALVAAVEAGQEFSRNLGYAVMMLRTPKAMARYAERRLGFVVDEREIVNMSCLLLTEESLCHF